MWVSATILVIVYAFLISETINRSILALLGGGLMIFCGLLNGQQAVAYIDFNTLWLLMGMMIIVNITAKTGMFQYVAIRATKAVNAHPIGILFVLCWLTALFSALLDNVTTVLLITPVVLLITEQLDIKAFPYLFATIVSSNIGGTSTLIGDPPNIIIGSAIGFSFLDFIIHLGPVVLLLMLLLMASLYLMFRKQLKVEAKARERIMNFDENEAITDAQLLKKCLFVFGLVLAGFFAGHRLHIEPGIIALAGGALLMLLAYGRQPADQQSQNIHHVFGEVEWITIFFFMGLFMIVGAVEHSGLLGIMGEKLLAMTQGNLQAMSAAVLWISAILSSFLDNIPFVATMIPLLESAELQMNSTNFDVVWWSLSLGACLGGNGTLIGASANLTVAAFAERAKQPIRMLQYTKYAFGIMLSSVLISQFYILIRYFHLSSQIHL